MKNNYWYDVILSGKFGKFVLGMMM